MNTFLRYILIFAVLFLITACRTMRPLSDTRVLDRHPIKNIVVVLQTPFSLQAITTPAGRYAPIFEDEGGVYFQSPTKLAWGGSLVDGGLYFEGNNTEQVYLYVLISGTQPRLYKLPPDFKFEIESKQ